MRGAPFEVVYPCCQIHENLTRLCAFSWTDVTAVFKDVQNARGAGVAKPQAALEQRSARLLFLLHDLNALVDEFLIFVTYLLTFSIAAALQTGLN